MWVPGVQAWAALGCSSIHALRTARTARTRPRISGVTAPATHAGAPPPPRPAPRGPPLGGDVEGSFLHFFVYDFVEGVEIGEPRLHATDSPLEIVANGLAGGGIVVDFFLELAGKLLAG